jgi:hypothetical protein
MTTIATFITPEDTYLFRAFLVSEGIEGFLRHEYTIQNYWICSNAVGGVQLDVAEVDADAAKLHYSRYMEALRAGPYPLNPVRAWPIVALVTLLFGIPLLLFGRRTTRD